MRVAAQEGSKGGIAAMNKTRRAALIKVVVQLTKAKDTLMELKEQEMQYIDNLPESLTETDNAAAAEQAVDDMDTAIDTLQETTDIITAITGEGEQP